MSNALEGLRLHRATGRKPPPEPSDLIRRYRTYFLAGVLSFRGLSGVPPLVNLVAICGLRPVLSQFAVWLVAVAVNFAFVPLVLRRWERSNADVLPWLALDGGLAIGLNVWAAATIPGSVNEPYHDLFFFWCMGTAVLWAAWFGTRAGLLVSLAALPLQVVMTAVSGGMPASASVPVIVARTAWLVVGTSSGWLILWIMRIAAEGVRAEGVRVGEKSARIRALRQLHDTVAVVDDHPLFRSAVVGAFEGVTDMTVVLECGSVEELETRLDTAPDAVRVVLLDLSLPGRSGAEAVRAVVRRGPAVLVLSGSAVRAQLVDVVAGGARGYLVKTARAEEIVQATRSVAAGNGYLAPEVASMLAVAMGSRGPQLTDITAREREVLVLLAGGMTDRMIAAELTISLATVRSHLDRIRSKTGSRRRAELTRLALRAGLTDPDAT